MVDDVLDVFTIAFAEKIFKYPGASARWLVLRKKKSFKEILEEKTNTNFITGIIVTAPLYLYIAIILGRYLL